MIATLDQYIAAVKQRIELTKTVAKTTLATFPFSVFELAGQPGAGVVAGTSTVSGVMPTDATAGFPDIFFATGVGYLSKVEFNSSVSCRLSLFDMLFKSGAYAFNGGTINLSGQPVISGRCPDLNGAYFGAANEIWIEVVTAFVTGTVWQVQITYTNQAGVAGCVSVASLAANGTAANLIQGRMFQIALQPGDTGVQKIESVTMTVGGMTAGTFNVLIMRPLWTSGRVPIANGGDIHDMLKTGLPVVYGTSALFLQVAADSTSSGLPECNIEIASA
jgi:hypothetical protein